MLKHRLALFMILCLVAPLTTHAQQVLLRDYEGRNERRSLPRFQIRFGRAPAPSTYYSQSDPRPTSPKSLHLFDSGQKWGTAEWLVTAAVVAAIVVVVIVVSDNHGGSSGGSGGSGGGGY